MLNDRYTGDLVGFERLIVREQLNGPGGWSLTAHVDTPGALPVAWVPRPEDSDRRNGGIIITDSDNQRTISGFTTRSQIDETGRLTARGWTHNAYINDRLILPLNNQADPANWGAVAKATYSDAVNGFHGIAATILDQVLGSQAHVDRQLAGYTSTFVDDDPLQANTTADVTAQMDRALDFINERMTPEGVSVRLVALGDGTYSSRSRQSRAPGNIVIDADLGIATKVAVVSEAQTGNVIYFGGAKFHDGTGTGPARDWEYRDQSDNLPRRVEHFAQDTTLTEPIDLAKAADDTKAELAAKRSITVVLDTETSRTDTRFGTDFEIGDRMRVFAFGEEILAPIVEVVTSITRGVAEQRLVFGDALPLETQTVVPAQSRRFDRRIHRLEK